MRTIGRQARSAVDGFLRGFSMVMDIKNANRSQDRQDKYLGLATDRDARDAESHAQRLAHNAAQETRAQETHERAGETHEQLLGLNRQRNERAQETHDAAMADRAETNRRRTAREWAAAIANDLEQHGKVTMGTLKGWSDAMDINLEDYLKPEFRESLAHLEGVVAGENKWRDPRTVRAMNTVFGPMIQRNVGETNAEGTKITGKQIVDVYPGPKGQTLVFQLAVTGEDKDGKPVSYEAPMTKNRSAAGDDTEVLEVPIDNFIKHIKGRDMLARAIEMGAVDSDDFSQELLAQHSDRAALTSGGTLPHEQLGLPKKDNTSTHMTTAQWLMEADPSLTREQALRISQGETPMEFAQEYADSKLKAQAADLAGPAPGEEGYKDYETLVREGVQMYERLVRSRPASSPNTEPAADVMRPDPADVEIGRVAIMADGTAWTKNPDGSLRRVK